MSDFGDGTIGCEHCGKRFRWKPEIAGKRMKCPCGAVIIVPARAVDTEGIFDLFDQKAIDAPPLPRAAPVADEVAVGVGAGGTGGAARKARPATKPAGPAAGVGGTPPLDADAIVARRLGVILPPRSKVRDTGAAVQEGRHEMEALAAGSVFRDVIAPIPLILAGLVLSFVQVQYWSERPAGGAGAALAVVLARALLGVGLMLLAMFLLTRLFDVNFMGSFGRCVLRLCAIAIAPAAVYDAAVFLTGGEMGGALMGALASVALYGILFWALMRVDVKDATVCMVVTYFLVAMANYLAFRAEGIIGGHDI